MTLILLLQIVINVTIPVNNNNIKYNFKYNFDQLHGCVYIILVVTSFFMDEKANILAQPRGNNFLRRYCMKMCQR